MTLLWYGNWTAQLLAEGKAVRDIARLLRDFGFPISRCPQNHFPGIDPGDAQHKPVIGRKFYKLVV
jgi:hypothetical protein